MDILKEVSQYQDFMVEHRRYLHRHPELSGLENNTVEHIKGVLEESGIDYFLGKTDELVLLST